MTDAQIGVPANGRFGFCEECGQHVTSSDEAGEPDRLRLCLDCGHLTCTSCRPIGAPRCVACERRLSGGGRTSRGGSSGRATRRAVAAGGGHATAAEPPVSPPPAVAAPRRARTSIAHHHAARRMPELDPRRTGAVIAAVIGVVLVAALASVALRPSASSGTAARGVVAGITGAPPAGTDALGGATLGPSAVPVTPSAASSPAPSPAAPSPADPPPAAPSPPSSAVPPSPAASPASGSPAASAPVVATGPGRLEPTDEALIAWQDEFGEVRAQVVVVARNEGGSAVRVPASASTWEVVDPEGRIVTSGRFAHAFPRIVGPGATVSLIETVTATLADPGELADLRVSVVAVPVDAAESIALDLADLTLDPDPEGGVAIGGQVSNPKAEAARDVALGVVVRGQDGSILGGVYDVSIDTLAAGEARTFTTDYPGMQPIDPATDVTLHGAADAAGP